MSISSWLDGLHPRDISVEDTDSHCSKWVGWAPNTPSYRSDFIHSQQRLSWLHFCQLSPFPRLTMTSSGTSHRSFRHQSDKGTAFRMVTSRDRECLYHWLLSPTDLRRVLHANYYYSSLKFSVRAASYFTILFFVLWLPTFIHGQHNSSLLWAPNCTASQTPTHSIFLFYSYLFLEHQAGY